MWDIIVRIVYTTGMWKVDPFNAEILLYNYGDNSIWNRHKFLS